MSINSIEKIYNNIMNIGRMSLNTIVTTGTKNNDNMRLDSFYYNTFKSEKYADADMLDQLRINNQKYLGLIYKGKNENNEFESDEVWIGEKYLENFREFLIDSYEQISSNADAIYGKNSVNPEYDEFQIQTGYEEDGSGYGNIDGNGHVLYVYPEVCFIEGDNKISYPGIVLVIEKSDGKQFAQEMSLNTYRLLASTVKDYNLLQDSRATIIEGMLYQLLSNGGGAISTPNKKNNLSRPLKSRNGGNVIKPLTKRTPLSEVINNKAANEDNDEEVETEVEETKTTKKKISSGKKVVAKKTNKVALNDILNESEEIELDLDDEEGEEY